MPYPSKTIVLQNGTLAATPSDVFVNVPEQYTGFIGYVQVGTVTGTSPTLDVKIYQGVKLPATADTAGLAVTSSTDYANNYVWVPYCQLKQITTTNQKTIFGASETGQYNAAVATTLAFPTAGTFQNGPIGSVWKVSFVVAGTNPSFGSVKSCVQFLSVTP
jgi:hypothetical protein